LRKGAATDKTGGKIGAEYTKAGEKSGIAIEARADNESKKALARGRRFYG